MLITKLPKDFLARLDRLIPAKDRESVYKSFQKERVTTFRANTLKISPSELRNYLFEMGIKVENVLWYKNAFILKNIPLKKLTDLDLYKQGYFYVQSLSSMIPPLVLDPKPGEKVFDICAAPGSKTTQMATMMENKGEIIANDISPLRSLRLQANLKMQGATNVEIEKTPAQQIWNKYFEYFDKTLVDVPCSMEGRFSLNDPKSYSGWSLKKVNNLSRMQRWILRSAISATKPGGIIVYSTCTLSPEENEEVIDWILNKEKGKITLEKFLISNLEFLNGINEWEGKIYNPEVRKCARILPSNIMEGFFVAKIRKVKSNN